MSGKLDVLYSSLQGRYAKALFDEGVKNGELEQIKDNFESIISFFESHKGIHRSLVVSLFDGQLPLCQTFSNFMRVVAGNDRMNIFSKIKYVYDLAFNKYTNRRDVTIYSVIELKEPQKNTLEALISKFFTEDVAVKYEIDENLLGGIKIVSDGKVIDASVATQVRQLEDFCKEIKLERLYENQIS